MNIYVCTNHDGFFPVGVASVVVANDEDEARNLLDTALHVHGLDPEKKPRYTLRKINSTEPRAFILLDGDY